MDHPGSNGLAAGHGHGHGHGHAQHSSISLAPLTRKSSDGGFSSNGGSGPSDLPSAIIDSFKATLREAEAYTSFYEARLKVEEEYLRSFKTALDKQRDLDSKIDGKSGRATVIVMPNGQTRPSMRSAWHELRENDLRELDTRSHMVETIRQGVLLPLTSFRDAQERIRKRVKEDLRTHLAEYDEMRNSTLPRIKRQYDRKCEEVDALRVQQMAAEDQKALLSGSMPGTPGLLDAPPPGPGSSSGGSYHSPEGSDMNSPPNPPRPLFQTHNSLPNPSRQGSDSTSVYANTVTGARTQIPAGAAQVSSPPMGSSGVPPPQPIGVPVLSPSSGASSGSFIGSPPSMAAPLPGSSAYGSVKSEKDDKKPNFFDALRNKDGWETARKEAPRKINAFISRMRDGQLGSDKADRDTLGASTIAASVGDDSGGGVSGLFGREPSIRGGGTHAIALKAVKAKRESEELDRTYRKAIFDLETLRIRREKTIAAAIESCKECKRELAHTAQSSWLQAERAGLLLSSSNVSLKTHAEQVALSSTAHLDAEIRQFESSIPHIEQVIEDKVTYVNYWHGECQDLLFGTSLTDYAFSHNRGAGAPPQPPLIVTKCIQFLEARAMKQPGLYRISAKHSALQELAHAIEKNEARFEFDPARDDPAAVAGLLKLYLRQLPEPVLPIPWEERIKYTYDREEHIQTDFPMLKSRIRRAPAINQVTLKAIVEHLARVAAHSAENKMTASNLAVVFGPVLLSEADHSTTSLAAAMEEDKTMEDLITYSAQIFGSSGATQATASQPLAATQPQATPSSEAVFGPTAVVAPDAPVSTPGTTALKRSSAIIKGGDSLSHFADGSSGSARAVPPPPPQAHARTASSTMKSSADHYAGMPDDSAPPSAGPLDPSRSSSMMSSAGHSHEKEGSAEWRATSQLYVAATDALDAHGTEGGTLEQQDPPASALSRSASNGHVTPPERT